MKYSIFSDIIARFSTSLTPFFDKVAVFPFCVRWLHGHGAHRGETAKQYDTWPRKRQTLSFESRWFFFFAVSSTPDRVYNSCVSTDNNSKNTVYISVRPERTPWVTRTTWHNLLVSNAVRARNETTMTCLWLLSGSVRYSRAQGTEEIATCRLTDSDIIFLNVF